jgi:hypothetical protein
MHEYPPENERENTDYCLLRCDAVLSARYLSTYRRIMLLQSSWSPFESEIVRSSETDKHLPEYLKLLSKSQP